MKIQQMFYDDIDRKINGVVKVDQDTADVLKQEVQEYVMSFKESGKFLKKVCDLLEFLLPNYVKEGKHQLVVAVGCTGGKHRSVTLANAMYDRLKEKGEYGLTISHRDEKRV